MTDPENVPQFVFQDFSDYPLRGSPYSAFMATPILASNGAVIGVFAVRIETAALQPSAAAAEGLGQSGVLLAVGGDGRIRIGSGAGLDAGSQQEQTGPNGPVASALSGSQGVQTDETRKAHRSFRPSVRLNLQAAHGQLSRNKTPPSCLHRPVFWKNQSLNAVGCFCLSLLSSQLWCQKA